MPRHRSLAPLRATALVLAASLAACSSEPQFSIRQLDEYDWEGARVESHVALESILEIAALVGEERLVADIAPDGVVTIAGLPSRTPFVLEIVELPMLDELGAEPFREYRVVDGVTPIRIGGRYYYRETRAITEPTPVELDVTTPVPYAYEDQVIAFSARADGALVLDYPADEGDEGATALRWSFDALDVGTGVARRVLPDVALGDDLQIVHLRREALGVTRWNATRVLASTSDGELGAASGTVTISGTLEEPARDRALELDLPVRAAHQMLGVPAELVRAYYADATVYHEPGSGPGMLYGVAPPALSVDGLGRIDVDRTCADQLAENGWCDGEMCPLDCGTIRTPRPLDDLRTSLRYPDVYTHSGSPVLYATTTISFDQAIPGVHDPLSQRVWISRALPLESASGVALEPVVSPPRGLRVEDTLLPLDGAADRVGSGPTLAWDAPELGQPNLYTVTVHEIVRRESRAERVTQLRILTRETSFTIPEGTLMDGRIYTFQVAAHQDGRRLEQPDLYPSRELASATMVSGIFTPNTFE